MALPVRKKVPTGLVGEANEAKVIVEGVECTGLIDSGSQVFTVNENFYREKFSSIPLQPIRNILKIECAAGQHLPYAGYIEAEIEIPGKDVSQTSLFLVVPETDYSSSVLVLVGTNILRSMRGKWQARYGPRFLQKAALATPWWLAFQHLGVQERQLKQVSGQVGVLKCATKNTVGVPPGGRVVVPAMMGKSKLPGDCLVMVQTTEKSVLPDGVEVTPALRVTKDTQVINVEISNLRSAPLLIQPSVVIGELQAMTAASEDGPPGECKLSRTEKGIPGYF